MDRVPSASSDDGDEQVGAPRPCPFCQTITTSQRDYRFATTIYRWDCGTHGVVGFLVIADS